MNRSITIVILLTSLLVVCITVAIILAVFLTNKSKSSQNPSNQIIVRIKAFIDDYELNDQYLNTSNTSSSYSFKIAANSVVYLNYTYIGTTDSNGEIELKINNSIYDLHVINRYDGYGYNAIGYLNDSSVYLLSSYEEPLITNFNNVDDSVFFYPLNYIWTSFNVYFHYKNSIKKEQIRQVRAIQLYSSLVPDTLFDITHLFTLDSYNNTILLNDTSTFNTTLKNIIQKQSSIQLKFIVDLDLTNDVIYLKTSVIDLYLTQFNISGKLDISSNKDIFTPESTAFSIISVTNSNLKYYLQVNKNGQFNSEQLPIGTYYFEAKVNVLDQTYLANGNILLSSNIYLNITLLTLNETLYGLSSFTYKTISKRNVNMEFKRKNESQKSLIGTLNIQTKRDLSNTVKSTVTSSTQNKIITNIKELVINNQVKSLRLTYKVQSAEYPFYVKTQSIFNDLWSVSVYTDSNVVLYSFNKDVNSMLYTTPLWLETGSTETITVDLDVSNMFSLNKQMSVFLKVTSVNIGDSLYSTSVIGTLENGSSDLKIKTLDFIDFVPCVSSSSPNPCYKVKNALSIPLNKKNLRQKYLKVDYESTQNVQIEKVEVYFVAGSEILTLSSQIDNDNVKQINTQTLHVRISFVQINTINFTLFNKFNIKVVISYKTLSDLETTKTSDKLSGLITALWEAPFYDTISKRYSTQESGGDGWASVNMYKWINANDGILWTRYNDISGEHTLNLGHASHQLGNHVDIFHYYSIDSSSGKNNFNAFLKALNSKNVPIVKAWIEAHRVKFDLLNANNQVVQFITHKGTLSGNLPNDWLRQLMEKGKIKNLIDLDLTNWNSPAKIRWVSDHKDHIHIQVI